VPTNALRVRAILRHLASDLGIGARRDHPMPLLAILDTLGVDSDLPDAVRLIARSIVTAAGPDDRHLDCGQQSTMTSRRRSRGSGAAIAVTRPPHRSES
jgi:hypothetical protein